jgi:hypothetical protein
VNRQAIIQKQSISISLKYADIIIDDSFECALLGHIHMHIYIIIIQITVIKYDITPTMLSFFIFSNVLRRDIAKNPVKFCYLSSQILGNF